MQKVKVLNSFAIYGCLGGILMKGTYYKNWYQHYKTLQDEQYKQKQQAYFSDSFTESERLSTEINVLRAHNYRANHNFNRASECIPNDNKYKQKSSKFLGFLLPFTTIAGFLFFWHMLGIAPFGIAPTDWVPDSVPALVSGVLNIENDTNNIDDYITAHHNLMELHTEINAAISTLMQGDELDFNLQILYDYIDIENAQLVASLDENLENLHRFWILKMQSLSAMMQYLDDTEAAADYYDQFLEDQVAIATFLNEAIQDLEKTD